MKCVCLKILICLNGSTGEVYKDKVETKAAELSGDFAELMDLADKYTKLQVRTNADTPHDAEVARNFGAVGIGLCRSSVIPTRSVSSSTVKSDLSRAAFMISLGVSGCFCTMRSPPYIIIWISFMLIMA